MKTFKSLDHFAQNFGSEVERVGRRAQEIAQEIAAQRVEALAKQIAPVGSKETGDRKPGRLKASIRRVAEAGRQKVVSDAPHGGIIDRGRKRGITPRGHKRVRTSAKSKPHPEAPMLGSRKAPKGIRREVRKALESEKDQVLARAIREAEQEG